MSAQEALWQDPLWTDAWSPGVRVRNLWTGNTGVVTAVVAGRHLLVRWDRWQERQDSGHLTRHGSDLGLEVAL